MGLLDHFLLRRQPKGTQLLRRGVPAITRPSMPLVAIEKTPIRNYWLESAAITDVGLVRSNNEDNVRLLPDAQRGIALALLADGMGGHASGEVASAMALESMMESYQNRKPGEDIGGLLTDAVTKANLAVWRHAQASTDNTGMGTTLCALAFAEQGAFFSWIGDSRIFLCRDGELRQLTRDDTLVNHLLKEGLLTVEQAERHPDAHVLSQALGTHDALQSVHVEQLQEPLDFGDVFLLTSDGVHDVLSSEQMTNILETHAVHLAAQELIEAAKRAGSSDNLSAVVIRVAEPKDPLVPQASTRF